MRLPVGAMPMKVPECVASCRPKAAIHSPCTMRASSMHTLSENAAWNGRCQLSWNALTPSLVPQPALPSQRKSLAKNASMPSMVWSFRPSTMPSTTRRVASVWDRSLSRVSAACSGRAPFMRVRPARVPAGTRAPRRAGRSGAPAGWPVRRGRQSFPCGTGVSRPRRCWHWPHR